MLNRVDFKSVYKSLLLVKYINQNDTVVIYADPESSSFEEEEKVQEENLLFLQYRAWEEKRGTGSPLHTPKFATDVQDDSQSNFQEFDQKTEIEWKNSSKQ